MSSRFSKTADGRLEHQHTNVQVTVTVSGSEEVTRARELLRKEKLFKLCETLCDKFLGSVKHFILTATR